MRNVILIYSAILWFASGDLSGQTYWLESKVVDKQSVFQDRSGKTSFETDRDGNSINFHPTAKLVTPAALPLDKSTYAQCQIFTVYQSNKTDEEGLIWKMSYEGKDQLLGTDHRMVDLSIGKYMNYIDYSPFQPQMTSYQHYRSDFAADQMFLVTDPSSAEIPAKAYQGAVAEMIVFDRMLAPATKQAVESYLAVKYSIPLATGLDYVDLKDNAYWKYSDNKDYAYRVAGLGRYDLLGLDQRQSKSTFGDGRIGFSLGTEYLFNSENPNQMPDESYLIWSDDDGAIDFKEEQGNTPALRREWKVNIKGSAPISTLHFAFTHSGLARDLDQENNYWLQWSSDSEESRIEEMNWYLLADNGNTFSAGGIAIPTEKESFFTIRKAPEMFAQLAIQESDCSGDRSGRISFRPIGGKAPYEIELADHSGELVYESWQQSGDLATVSDLATGKYELILKDATGRNYNTEFYLNGQLEANLDLPKSFIVQNNNESFTIPSNGGGALDFTWISPTGEKTYGETVQFGESGIYTLMAEKEDCKSWYDIEVIHNQSIIESTSLSPNPSSDGYFKYEAVLKRAAPYTLAIHDVAGTEHFRASFPATKYIAYQNRLLRPGTYLISLLAEGTIATDKLIVIK